MAVIEKYSGSNLGGWMILAWTITVLTAGIANVAAADDRPNIVLIVADDAGYADVSSFGSQFVTTPHIDRIGREGVRFTDFYAACPNCSPSRAAIFTGKTPARVGIYSYLPRVGPMHLRKREPTLSRALHDAGYHTGAFGKWHLNSDISSTTQAQPNDHGFDYWFCTANNALPSHHNPENFYRNGSAVGTSEGYSAQIVMDEALQWLASAHQGGKPFFLYLPFHEPHRVVAAPDEFVQRHLPYTHEAFVKDVPDAETLKREKPGEYQQLFAKYAQEMPVYWACLEHMDAQIGRLLSYLDDHQLAGNTIVMFMSDNGSLFPSSNTPFRGVKGQLWEGGIREPAAMRWPARIQAGQAINEALCGYDLYPTLCSLAGVPIPNPDELDGVDFTPLLTGSLLQRERPLFWYFYPEGPQVAMREGQYMLVGHLSEPAVKIGHQVTKAEMDYIRSSELQRFALYDLQADVTQQNDIQAQRPERLESMKAKMIARHKAVIAEGPYWHK